MRSTGLYYGRNEQLPDERVITYESGEAVQRNPATSDHMNMAYQDKHSYPPVSDFNGAAASEPRICAQES